VGREGTFQMQLKNLLSISKNLHTIGIVFLCIFLIALPLTFFVAQNFREERHQVTSLSMPSDGQGLYESCPLHWGTSCLNRLKQIASGGFKLVLNYDQMAGSAAQQIAYFDQAQALGMKVIFAMNNPALWDGTNLRNWYASLGVSCNCNDNVGFIEYVVKLVKNHPALWGYYIGDVVNAANHTALKAFSVLVHRTDPVHLRLFVSCSQCPHTYPPYVASLIPMTDSADVVATDYYPVGSDGWPITDTGTVAAALQSVANRNGRQSAMVLQVFGWAQYVKNSGHTCFFWPFCATFPSYNQMRQMRDLVLQNSHPRLILWYSYFDILRSDSPSTHWKDLIAAASTNVTPEHTSYTYTYISSMNLDDPDRFLP